MLYLLPQETFYEILLHLDGASLSVLSSTSKRLSHELSTKTGIFGSNLCDLWKASAQSYYNRHFYHLRCSGQDEFKSFYHVKILDWNSFRSDISAWKDLNCFQMQTVKHFHRTSSLRSHLKLVASVETTFSIIFLCVVFLHLFQGPKREYFYFGVCCARNSISGLCALEHARAVTTVAFDTNVNI
jgi:hypothetical protein